MKQLTKLIIGGVVVVSVVLLIIIFRRKNNNNSSVSSTLMSALGWGGNIHTLVHNRLRQLNITTLNQEDCLEYLPNYPFLVKKVKYICLKGSKSNMKSDYMRFITQNSSFDVYVSSLRLNICWVVPKGQKPRISNSFLIFSYPSPPLCLDNNEFGFFQSENMYSQALEYSRCLKVTANGYDYC